MKNIDLAKPETDFRQLIVCVVLGIFIALAASTLVLAGGKPSHGLSTTSSVRA